MSNDVPGFERTTLTFTDVGRGVAPTKDVYRRGTGPAVIVMSEVPGITPEVRKLAHAVAEAGFSVWMPQLFGTPMKPMSAIGTAGVLASLCVSREFALLACDESSPVVDWLRALARHAHAECGGPGVGAIGMCITGNFALGMMLGSPVVAPVLSQPSLPVGISPKTRRSLHASKEAIDAVREKIATSGARVLGLRFLGDILCPGTRFARLREELGDGFEAIELDPRDASPRSGTPAHSVLTVHLIDEAGEPTRAALDRTLAFLSEQLRPERNGR